MEVQIHAAILLGLRIIAATLLFPVLKTQLQLFRSRDDSPKIHTKEVKFIGKYLNRLIKSVSLRQALFCLVLVIFIGQFVPVLLDAAAATGKYRSSNAPQFLGFAYVYSNAITAVVASAAINLVYRLALLGSKR